MQFNHGINPEYTEIDANENPDSTAKYAKQAKQNADAKKYKMQFKCNASPKLGTSPGASRRPLLA